MYNINGDFYKCKIIEHAGGSILKGVVNAGQGAADMGSVVIKGGINLGGSAAAQSDEIVAALAQTVKNGAKDAAKQADEVAAALAKKADEAAAAAKQADEAAAAAKQADEAAAAAKQADDAAAAAKQGDVNGPKTEADANAKVDANAGTVKEIASEGALTWMWKNKKSVVAFAAVLGVTVYVLEKILRKIGNLANYNFNIIKIINNPNNNGNIITYNAPNPSDEIDDILKEDKIILSNTDCIPAIDGNKDITNINSNTELVAAPFTSLTTLGTKGNMKVIPDYAAHLRKGLTDPKNYLPPNPFKGISDMLSDNWIIIVIVISIIIFLLLFVF